MNFEDAWRDAAPIPSAVTQEEARLLFRYARRAAERDEQVVEVGTFRGRSAVLLARSGAKLACVDPWAPWVNHQGRMCQGATVDQFRSELQKRVLLHRVQVIRATSAEAAARWDGGPIGLMFIDGVHTADGTRTDWHAWAPHLLPGAVIAWHDYTLHGEPGHENSGVHLTVDWLVVGGNVEIIDRAGSLVVTRFLTLPCPGLI